MKNLVLWKFQPQKSILEKLSSLREIFLSCLGELISASEIRIPGAAEAILSAGHIKRTRYVQQLNAAALYTIITPSLGKIRIG